MLLLGLDWYSKGLSPKQKARLSQRHPAQRLCFSRCVAPAAEY